MPKPKKTTPAPAKAAQAKRAPIGAMTRQRRWDSAVSDAKLAKEMLDDAIAVLVELRDEFEMWRDNMPENLHGSPTYEKLDEICDLEIDRDAIMDHLDFLDTAEGLDLPVGFGRD